MSKTQVPKLTEQQQQFYDTFLARAFIPGRINWPTTREMVEHCDLSSTSEANRYFLILAQAGYLVQDAPREQYRLPGWRFVARLTFFAEDGER